LDLIKAFNIKNNEALIRERGEYQQRKEEFMLEVTTLSQQIAQLNTQLGFKEEEFQEKSNILL
jgi:hypothetical protein